MSKEAKQATFIFAAAIAITCFTILLSGLEEGVDDALMLFTICSFGFLYEGAKSKSEAQVKSAAILLPAFLLGITHALLGGWILKSIFGIAFIAFAVYYWWWRPSITTGGRDKSENACPQ